MVDASLADSFRGVNVVVTTPFTEDHAEVRYDALRENVAFLRDAGVELYIPCGGASEYDSLTTAERVRVVEETVDVVGDAGHVVPGVGGSPAGARDLLERYEAAGAHGAMVFFPVTHAGVHERGLVEYYRDLAASTDLGLMLYHRGDDRLTNDVIADLADVDNVVAVKWAIDDVEAFGAAVEAIPADRLVWVDGLAELSTIPYFAEGAEGFTSGIANFVPELSLALMAALRDGDEERAAELRAILRPIQELRSERGADNTIPGANGVSVLKYGQDLAGLYGGPLRPPSVELAAEDRERAAAYYDRIQRASW